MGRVLGLVAVLLAMMITAPVGLVLPGPDRAAWWQLVARAVLAVMGIRVVVRGPRRFGDAGVLVVANHVSWVEVLALATVQPVRVVAKQEVRGWFLIGPLAAALGCLFVDRRGLHRLPTTVGQLAAALHSGHAVVVFPEGTTWCGFAAGPFRRAAFQAALDAGVPVRPVGITLRRDGHKAPEAAFVGSQPLLSSIGRVLCLSGLACELTVLPLLLPVGDRAELARRAAASITEATGVVHPVSALRAGLSDGAQS